LSGDQLLSYVYMLIDASLNSAQAICEPWSGDQLLSYGYMLIDASLTPTFLMALLRIVCLPL
jgi:hypothetical protein